jgi:hypothetical protein
MRSSTNHKRAQTVVRSVYHTAFTCSTHYASQDDSDLNDVPWVGLNNLGGDTANGQTHLHPVLKTGRLVELTTRKQLLKYTISVLSSLSCAIIVSLRVSVKLYAVENCKYLLQAVFIDHLQLFHHQCQIPARHDKLYS